MREVPRLKLRVESVKQKQAFLVVKGQGTVSVQTDASSKPFEVVCSDMSTKGSFLLRISENKVELWLSPASGGPLQLLSSKEGDGIGLNVPGLDEPYWLSIDKNNSRVRYGKGEMLRKLQLFEFAWIPAAKFDFDFVKNISKVSVSGTSVRSMEVLAVPINIDPSPHVVGPDNVTLESISANESVVVLDLPGACQTLYSVVAGPLITLRPVDFAQFPEAISHSILTPGCICYERLKDKDPQFGYLRVTIDGNLGDSPGQPYVLEIWPAGNGSPIHNHGRACAVINVLHGTITVSVFAALSIAAEKPWGDITFKEGDVTFLSPDYYQIHRLHNPEPKGGQFCATIQSYKYPEEDSVHYEYFDYIDQSKQIIEQFAPDSDWEYLEFKSLIRKEWQRRIASESDKKKQKF